MLYRPFYIVHWNVRLSALHPPQRQTALLQLRLGVIPLLVDYELRQPREEADLGELGAIRQVLVDVNRADECL